MKRVITVKVENRYDNNAPVEGGSFAQREYHFPLTIDSPWPDEIVDALDRILVEEEWLK